MGLDPTAIEQPDNPYQDRIFAECLADRERILNCLWSTSSISAFRIAEKIAKCCREPMIFTNDASDQIRLSERRCRSRLCPRCRKFRRGELQARLLEACKRMDARRFVTLTLVSSDRPLREQLCDMRKSFAKLRRSPLWKERVVGGVYCIEVTYNRIRRQWHPHLHAIVDGRFIPKFALSDAWQLASNGSSIVDVSNVPSASRVVNYVTKYVAKSDDASGFPDDKVVEWAVEVHGLRLVHTFGNLHGVQLLEKPESRPGVNKMVVNPTLLADRASRGDRVAADLFDDVQAIARGSTNIDQARLASRLRTWRSLYFLQLRSQSIEANDRGPPGDRCLWS